MDDERDGLEEHDTEVTQPGGFEQHDTEVQATAAASPPEPAAGGDGGRAFQDAPTLQDQLPTEPEIEPTKLNPIRPLTGERDASAVAGVISDDADTLDMPPPSNPPAHQDLRLQRDSVKVYGAEGEAARLLEQQRAMQQRAMQQRARQRQAMQRQSRQRHEDAAGVLEPPRTPRPRGSCRICGRKVTAPEPRRFRGPPEGPSGFRCDRCHNLFCAAHVVRSSGLLRSLLSGGSFRCLVCREAPRR